jgi:hypothetical protein
MAGARAIVRRAIVAASLFTFGLATGAQANSLTVFNNGPAPGLDIDLVVSVGGGLATFKFTNNSTGSYAGADVHEIYFESGLSTLLKNPFVANATGTSGASLTNGAAPPNPPGAPGWQGNLTGQGFDSGNSDANKLSLGDTWVVTFTLVNAATSADKILDAVFDLKGHSRIALHIGDCNRNSCGAFIARDADSNTPLPTPLPPAAVLMGTVLGGFWGANRWRRRRKVKAAA